MSDINRTKQLLDIIFPPAITPEVTEYEWLHEDDGHDALLSFTYQNRQGGKTRNWTVDLDTAVFFTFRYNHYMVIRGERGGPVCFDMNRMVMEDNLTVECLCLEYLEADPDCFPTEDTQDWILRNAEHTRSLNRGMLSQKGF
jgi:hypothetical protein